MSGKKTWRKGVRGMSLVEAAVILAIVGIVLAVTLPGLGEARRAAVLGGYSKYQPIVFLQRRIYLFYIQIPAHPQVDKQVIM